MTILEQRAVIDPGRGAENNRDTFWQEAELSPDRDAVNVVELD